ncbi:MAG TPA: MauE/DoxX family redox-associated membrane protein [Verrucomicrobiae bacterium]|jgi:uncharacterized membrane protein YphA (DoxX/SURF4 family)|nr:MauE/DoxX family redox-associated membrane protein [Verrucomicrobiae bacterium]
MNGIRATWMQKAGAAARIFLGALFLYMGATKALHPEAFLKLVRQYELTDNHLVLNTIAATLPWFEMYCGLLLICGVAVRGASLILALILMAFTAAIWQRGLHLEAVRGIPFCAVKFDCGCGNGEVMVCHKITENLGLILLSLWLFAGQGRLWAVKYSLGRA